MKFLDMCQKCNKLFARLEKILFLAMWLSTFKPIFAQDNLALGKRLFFTPEPEYGYTNDVNDPLQLTDGVQGGSRHTWFHKETSVGWDHTSNVEITLDLKKICNVNSVKIHTLGGGYGEIEYPEFIVISSSIDGFSYCYKAMKSTDCYTFGSPQAIAEAISIRLDDCKCRYLKIQYLPDGIKFLTQEIEVWGTSLTSSDARCKGEEPKKIFESCKKIREVQKGLDSLTLFNNNLKDKNETLTTLINLFSSELNDAFNGKYNGSWANASELLEKKFYLLKARYLNAMSGNDWYVYGTDFCDTLRKSDMPLIFKDDCSINVSQWKNEHSISAFNLVNSSSSKQEFSIEFSPLMHNDGIVDSADVLELRRAEYVDIHNSGLTAEPLVLQKEERFFVEPADILQFVLDVNSETLESGSYIAALNIECHSTKGRSTFPLKIEVLNKKMSYKKGLKSCNWSYPYYQTRFTRKNPKDTCIDLKSHHTNVSVIWPSCVYGFGKNTKYVSNELGFFILEEASYADFYLIGMSVKDASKGLGIYRTVEWEHKFNLFIIELRDYLKTLGLSYESYALYPFDELLGDDYEYVAKIIRQIDPKIQIYANKMFSSDDEFKRLHELVDIWCPHDDDIFNDIAKFKRYKDDGGFNQVWSYKGNIQTERFYANEKLTCSARWRDSNHLFFRTMPIVAIAIGLDGTGFWTYCDATPSGFLSEWDRSRVGYHHGVIYDGDYNIYSDIYEPIVPSKRWQMWREGVEDAVALKGHQDLLDEFMAKPPAEITSEYLKDLRKRADKSPINE